MDKDHHEKSIVIWPPIIYGETLPFEQLIKRMIELKQRINDMNWSE